MVADAAGETVPGFFSAMQMGILSRLADVMLPRTSNHPGALDAKTPEFLDFLIGHSPAVRGSLYINGLNWLEAQGTLKHKKPFAELETAQVDAIVKPWLRTWMTDHPPTQTHADFINIAHADIRTATVNSQVWFDTLDPRRQEGTTQLYWSPNRALCLRRAAYKRAHAPNAEHRSAQGVPPTPFLSGVRGS